MSEDGDFVPGELRGGDRAEVHCFASTLHPSVRLHESPPARTHQVGDDGG